MSNPLVKSISMSAAIVFMFMLTFVALFMRSRTAFVHILSTIPVAKDSPTAKAQEEHRQFVYWNFRTTEINKMITDLAEQRAALQAREEQIGADEARITSERKENERIREEITRSRKELTDFIVEMRSGEAAHLREQVAIFNSMTPDGIVSVFNEKSDAEVVKILALMKPDIVAQILETMMAQPAQPNAPTPQKRAATLLDMLKRVRQEADKAPSAAGK
jgi:flagellar motility protein MotE (MotC chaperone)